MMYKYDMYLFNDVIEFWILEAGTYEQVKLEYAEDSNPEEHYYRGSFESDEPLLSVKYVDKTSDPLVLYPFLAKCRARNFSVHFTEYIKWHLKNPKEWLSFFKQLGYEDTELYGHFFVMSEHLRYREYYDTCELDAYIASECWKKGFGNCLRGYERKLEIARERFPHFLV